MSNIKKLMMAAAAGGGPGEAIFTEGTYTWVVPDGVESVSVVAVGGGGGASRLGSGGGGELRYKNNISVTAGSSITVVAGAKGAGATYPDNLNSTDGGDSTFDGTVVVANGGGGVYPGTYRVGVLVAQAMAAGMAVTVLVISVQGAEAQGDTLVLAALLVVYGLQGLLDQVAAAVAALAVPMTMAAQPDQVAAV